MGFALMYVCAETCTMWFASNMPQSPSAVQTKDDMNVSIHPVSSHDSRSPETAEDHDDSERADSGVDHSHKPSERAS